MPPGSPTPSPTPTATPPTATTNVLGVSARLKRASAAAPTPTASPTPSPTPTPPAPQALPAREQERLDQARRAILACTGPETCNREVIAKLNTLPGFSLDGFKAYLRGSVAFYDGTKSRVPIAGNIYPEQAARSVARQAGLRDNATVADFFNRGGNTQTNAWASATSQTLTVFFRPSAITSDPRHNFALVFHEALHGYGTSIRQEYDDTEVLRVLGRHSPSGEITADIQEHCPQPTPTPTPSPTPTGRK
jgi:hypothetical protein